VARLGLALGAGCAVQRPVVEEQDVAGLELWPPDRHARELPRDDLRRHSPVKRPAVLETRSQAIEAEGDQLQPRGVAPTARQRGPGIDAPDALPEEGAVLVPARGANLAVHAAQRALLRGEGRPLTEIRRDHGVQAQLVDRLQELEQGTWR